MKIKEKNIFDKFLIWIFGILLKRHFLNHKNNWHHIDGCVFCHMQPSVYDNFMKKWYGI